MEVLEKMAMKLGYEKGEKLEFLNKRICGLWLIWIGIVIIIGTIVGGEFCIHPVVFGAGYFTGFQFILRNKFLRKNFSFGPFSRFQSKVGNLSIVLLFVLMGLISGRYFDTNDYRMIWMGALLATGIHFIPFAILHGKSMIYLSIPLIIITLFGLIDSNIPFLYVAIADGGIKVLFGIVLFLSKDPREKMTNNNTKAF